MPPFAILHVCMGNICRSPMAEVLTAAAARRAAGRAADDLLYVHSAGTGGWHAGQPMSPPAARQLRNRGGDPDRFRARQLSTGQIDGSDLLLAATDDLQQEILAKRPDAADRTFVLGEFGRLLGKIDVAALPPATRHAQAVYERGVALVQAVAQARGGRAPLPGDDLDDPWGLSEGYYARIADEIERTVYPLVTVLLPDGRVG